jgi:ornithine cyclodeaminase
MIMPATLGDFAGVKLLTVVPSNRGTSRPVISGLFTLFSLASGEPLATMDAAELTGRRTSAISAAAAERLALPDASTLVVLGAGHLAPFMAAALAAVRPIRHIHLWARRVDQANAAAGKIRQLITSGPMPVIEVASDLEGAIRSGDIITAATRATTPLIKGNWLRPGAHVDLVGGYKPNMREIDDDGVRLARIFVDDRVAAIQEAGDLIDPIERGVISVDDICGDLGDLCAGTVGRSSGDEITLFKAVGIGIVDLIAAVQIWEQRAENKIRNCQRVSELSKMLT